MSRVPMWLTIVGCLAVLAIVAGVLAVIPADRVALSPHAPLNLDKRVRIGGVVTAPLHGRLAMVDVQERSVSLLQSWLLRLDKRVTQEHEVENVSSPASVKEDQDDIKQSKQIAAEVAFGLAGKPARLTGDGAQVTSVDSGGPAAHLLKSGDIIVLANGKQVQTADAITSIVGPLAPGSVVTLGVRRNQRPLIVKLRTASMKGNDPTHRSRIGIAVDSSNLQIHLPQSVSIDTENIGGPSAGLAFAIAIYDGITGADLLGGRYVVATGELDLSGDVLPVGGVRQKTIAAQDAGYDVMFVPQSNLREATTAVHDFCKGGSKPCLKIVPVTSAKQTITLLKEDPAQLATSYAN